MFKDIKIETERLIIRPFTLNDAEQWHAVLSQPAVMHYLPEDVMTFEEARGIIEWYLDCYEKNTPDNIIKWTLAVCLSDNSELIGWAGVGPWEPDLSEVELFYGLSQEHWGKGFATEAARAVVEYAFSTIGLKRLIAVANPQNIGSVRVLEKIGMKFEKTLEGLPEKFSNDEGASFFVYESVSRS